MTSELIDEIYNAFSSYTLNERVTGCYCPVCLTDEFNQEMHSVSLHKIQAATFSFYVSAVGIAEGDCNDFKYFIPRMLELIYLDIERNESDWFFLSIWNVLERIDYSSWSPKETQLLIRFFKLYWDKTKDAGDPELHELTIESIKSTVFKALAI